MDEGDWALQETKGWLDVTVSWDGGSQAVEVYDPVRLEQSTAIELDQSGYFAARCLLVFPSVTPDLTENLGQSWSPASSGRTRWASSLAPSTTACPAVTSTTSAVNSAVHPRLADITRAQPMVRKAEATRPTTQASHCSKPCEVRQDSSGLRRPT
ncbi:hypothetical protein [Streptomyces lacrimifluminis]|nr:hypothetical protein [Streptomyces lacrimifluminis]